MKHSRMKSHSFIIFTSIVENLLNSNLIHNFIYHIHIYHLIIQLSIIYLSEKIQLRFVFIRYDFGYPQETNYLIGCLNGDIMIAWRISSKNRKRNY